MKNYSILFLFLLVFSTSSLVSACNSNADCTEQANGICGILQTCFYCSGSTPVFSTLDNKCVECNSNADCTEQTNGQCETTIWHTCHYCSGNTPYLDAIRNRCVECRTDSDCTSQVNGKCDTLMKNCLYYGTPCTESDWQYSLSPATCPSTGQQIKTWTLLNNCNQGTGVVHYPTEIINCVYSSTGNYTCTPNCAGKLCGDNGCAGSCGTCAINQDCIQGACITQHSNSGSSTCSEKIVRENYCAGPEIYQDKRQTNCNVDNILIEKCSEGCLNGKCVQTEESVSNQQTNSNSDSLLANSKTSNNTWVIYSLILTLILVAVLYILSKKKVKVTKHKK